MRSKALAAPLAQLDDDAVLWAKIGAAGLARAHDLYDEAKVVAWQLDLIEALRVHNA
ncbi:MAG: hypothetical protein O9320_13870 [Magnetospirillum sp.]|nr:hypothetical protein [Magnetospirillum sp.]